LILQMHSDAAPLSPGASHPLLARTLAQAQDHRRAGRLDAAELLFREVLAHRPDDAEALDGLRATGAIGAGAGDAEAPPAGAAAFARRLARRHVRPAIEAAAQNPRILKYRVLSTCRRVSGTPRILQPVLFVGSGEVVLGEDVQFGWRRSPLFYTGYCHVEAALPHARIELGDRVEFNNNTFLKSEGAGIRVGADGLFGAEVQIFDSNFHDLDPARRRDGRPRLAPVDIGPNVFVGMGVKILKGVTVGADSVLGAGAVVTSSIPAGVIAAGNPARVIREL
jgi:acetyltransferase-like isoleucine patch superfamily enzyme